MNVSKGIALVCKYMRGHHSMSGVCICTSGMCTCTYTHGCAYVVYLVSRIVLMCT